jgi:hypothetical protein
MAIDENDPRLKDMLRAIELGELPEDLNDPEEYDDMGGIKSLDRGAPSIKMASEPEDEFELELGTVIKEYNDLKEKGIIDIPIEDFINQYLSKKKKSPNMQMAGMGNVMKLFDTPYGFDRGAFEDMLIQYDDSGAKGKGIKLYEFATDFLGMVKKDTPSDRSMAMGGGPMRMPYAEGKSVKDLNVYDVVDKDKEDEYYKIKEEQMLRKYYPEDYPPSQRTMGMEDLRKMIKKAEQDKKKLAMGGIAGVL